MLIGIHLESRAVFFNIEDSLLKSSDLLLAISDAEEGVFSVPEDD